MTRVQKRLRELEEELAHRAGAAGHQTYSDALTRLFAVRREQYAVAARASERAAADAVRKLERIRPPAPVAAEHSMLVAGFRDHVAVAQAFHTATQAADVKAVGVAAEAWTKSISAVGERLEHVAHQLNYYERWPAPPPPAGAADDT